MGLGNHGPKSGLLQPPAPSPLEGLTAWKGVALSEMTKCRVDLYRALDGLLREWRKTRDGIPLANNLENIFDAIINTLDKTERWLNDLDLRLQQLQDATLIVGWAAIAEIVGCHKRTVYRNKKQLLKDNVITEIKIGKRKRIAAYLLDLMRYKLRKLYKT